MDQQRRDLADSIRDRISSRASRRKNKEQEWITTSKLCLSNKPSSVHREITFEEQGGRYLIETPDDCFGYLTKRTDGEWGFDIGYGVYGYMHPEQVRAVVDKLDELNGVGP